MGWIKPKEEGWVRGIEEVNKKKNVKAKVDPVEDSYGTHQSITIF